MLTSYFVLSFALMDVYRYDLDFSKRISYCLATIIPLGLFALLYVFNFLNFVSILGIGGVITGGLTGILILLMNKSAKVKGKRKPETILF